MEGPVRINISHKKKVGYRWEIRLKKHIGVPGILKSAHNGCFK